jgi:TPR repeat protein
MYNLGKGVPKDDSRARYWYLQAANKGNAEAQNNLGVMFRNGDGVSTDYSRAYIWFNLAASQGNETGIENLAILEQQMSPERVAEAQRLALKFQPR